MSHNRGKKVRSLTDKDSIETIVEFMQGVQARFDVSVSNYTTCINYIDKGQKYLKTFRGKKCFSAYRKIQKDVEQHQKPWIDQTKVRYFAHDIRDTFNYEKAIQIDLKKAYATVLYNRGFISADTYDYMNYISKSDRLAAVGMLASIRNEFMYEDGKLKNHKIKENPLKNFFYYCVKEVESIMNVCRMEANNNYILTWVDAIYIKYVPEIANEIRRILLYNGFECSISVLENFKCDMYGNKIKLSLVSDGVHKKFYIPNYKGVQTNSLVTFLKNTYHVDKNTGSI